MIENGATNRIEDALEVFENIANNKLLAKPSIILFLNKKDIFVEKVANFPIKSFFSDFQGKEKSYDQGTQFFEKKFTSLVLDKSRTIRVHLTCLIGSGEINF